MIVRKVIQPCAPVSALLSSVPFQLMENDSGTKCFVYIWGIIISLFQQKGHVGAEHDISSATNFFKNTSYDLYYVSNSTSTTLSVVHAQSTQSPPSHPRAAFTNAGVGAALVNRNNCQKLFSFVFIKKCEVSRLKPELK